MKPLVRRRVAITLCAATAAVIAGSSVAEAAVSGSAVGGRERIKVTMKATAAESCRVLIDGDSKALYQLGANEERSQVFQVGPAGMHNVEVECGANSASAFSNQVWVDPQNMVFEAFDQAMLFLGFNKIISIDPVYRGQRA